MTEKDIILSKWLEGKVSDEEVEKIVEGVDLEYLRKVLTTQEKLEVSVTDAHQQWDILESKLPPKIKPPAPKSSYRWIFLAILILGSALAYYLFTFINNKTIVKPDPNEFLQFAYEDGSTVRLWPQSIMKFDESSYLSNRYIELEGQAFFDVQKGTSFIVKTDAGEVQVLGTSFDVWNPDNKSTIVKCYSGRVRVVDNGKREVILTAGEKVMIENNQIGNLETFNMGLQQEDQTIKNYDNAKVEWVIQDLENLFGTSIQLESAIKSQRFTGIVSTTDFNRALSYLCEPMFWSYVKEGDVIKISAKD